MSGIISGISVYVITPDCSCGHPQNKHWYPGATKGCQQCSTCDEYDGVIETLGVGRSPDHLYPADYDSNGCLILPPELMSAETTCCDCIASSGYGLQT